MFCFSLMRLAANSVFTTSTEIIFKNALYFFQERSTQQTICNYPMVRNFGRCSGFYWEEEYVELVQKYLAQQADTAANEAVIQPKKPKDVAQSGDLSVLVEIGREILVLLKCILALVLLVVVGIVYIVAMLS